MDIRNFNLLINKTNIASQSDIGELEGLILKYPYFQGAIFTYLKALYNHLPETYESELERLSINIRDRRALFYHIFSEEYDRFFAETGKKEIPEDKTNILLNAFFESRGGSDMDIELEYNISHASLATTDYITYIQSQDISLDKTDNSSQLKHQDIIDTFISKSEEGDIHIQIEKDNDPYKDEGVTIDEKNENKDELSEDIFFTETLAKIYIKQKKYEKAYKIIKHLSLNYPKKNIYFADQLSFLEKLIINSKYKNKK
ncbi:MAG: hypothetical protein LBV71_05590 [Prevotella sp.]|jgi:hypothetical protein|nr:hypothetical protein [Prevotella sp.]